LGKIIGIDLGTTNSCVAVLEGGKPVVVPNEVGARTTPSVVAITKDGSVLLGAAAKRQAVANPRNTLFGVKRLVGRRYESAAVKDLKRTMPFEILRAPNGDAWVQIGGKQMSPPEISAHILGHMKKIAEDYLGETVDEAIVTVPAYFDDAQRQATKDAGKIAGLDVRAIVNEPTAAALAYGVHKSTAAARVAVFDLGGGTFDVSILRMEDGVFEVLATSGDTFLGGDDFDRAFMQALVDEFAKDTGVDLSQDPAALQRLKESAERAKHELSATVETEINLPFIGVGPEGPLHLIRTVSRAWFETLTEPLVDRLEPPCTRALEDAKLSPGEVDQIVLVGGMTRMPAVEKKAIEIFGKRPVKGVHPDEIVAIGAATQSGLMSGELEEVVLLDVTSHSLGIKIVGDKMSVIIVRNTTVPTRAHKIFKTTENDQDFVAVEIYQGDAPLVTDNRMIGRFLLGDLPQGPAGTVQVEVVFTLDADGILHVDATEIRTGRTTSKKVLASSGLTPDEVERLAGVHAEGAGKVRRSVGAVAG
jgi:molecular chaperone DnaK